MSNLRRSALKTKPCPDCGSLFHSKSFHKPRKPLAAPTRLFRRESLKTRQKRLDTTAEWFKLNPPDVAGHWHCYISKHPLCPKVLTRATIVLEHDQSKARRKDLQFNVKNIFPACSWDNQAKGSLSAAEYMAL